MTTDTTLQSAAPLSRLSRDQNTQSFWTAAAAAVEIIIIAGSTYIAFLAYNFAAYGAIPPTKGYAWASIALGLLYGALCTADNQYDLLGPKWNEHSRSRGIAAVLLAFALLLMAAYILGQLDGYSRGTFLAQFISALPAQIVTRTLLWQLIDRARQRGRWQGATMAMLVLPGARRCADVYERPSGSYEKVLRRYDLVCARGVSAAPCRLDAQLSKIRAECRKLHVDAILIVFNTDNMAMVTRAVAAMSEIPVRIQLLPVGMSDFMLSSRIGTFGRSRVLELVCGPCSLRDRLLKRGMDLVAATSLLVLLSPILAIVTILIKLDSKGPVLFSQTRHGLNNEPIRVLKFRSMTTFNDLRDEFCQAVRDDPRITRVGRLLRRTNIDELPQLINVLRGEMSMVGPRPHAVAHNDMFTDQICRMSRRHNVKPGITGWAQVNGLRGETDTIEKMRKRVEHDLYYIDNWSFFFDLKIMIMTVMSKDAYANAY